MNPSINKSTLAVLCAILIWPLAWATVWLLSDPDWTLQDSVDATVTVSKDSGWGSGVIIGKNSILTCRHLVRDIDILRDTLTIVHGKDAKEYRAIDIYLDPDSDLAIVYVVGLDFDRPAELLERPLALGEPVWLTGTPISLRGHLARGHVSGTRDGVSDDRGWDVLVNLDIFFGKGGSGGPVWVDGKVAALYAGGWYDRCSRMAGLGFAVPVSELDR